MRARGRAGRRCIRWREVIAAGGRGAVGLWLVLLGGYVLVPFGLAG